MPSSAWHYEARSSATISGELCSPGRDVRGYVIVGAPYQPAFCPLSCSSGPSIIGWS